jgi:sugar O-acyltransferase (sialic acid O-acetyltransferase NeuD family)
MRMSAITRKRLLLFPCNGNAREAVDALHDDDQLIGFIDDAPAKQGTGPYGFAVLDRRALLDFPDARVLAVPGSPSTYLSRRATIEGLGVATDRFATVIHPSARVSRFAKIGYNVLIMAGVVVTSNAIVGNHVCVLPNSVIHHDVSVGDWSLIGAGVTIGGGTTIGMNCYVGSGSSVINEIRIGDRTLVGLGANVIATVPADVRVVGNPARQIGIVTNNQIKSNPCK